MARRALTAVVLAGGPRDDVAALVPGAPNKAFDPVAGTALVTRTLEALRAAPEVGRIVVVAPRATHGCAALALADEARDDGATMARSLRAGLAGEAADDPVLVVASDLPVLTAVAIAEFLELAERGGADLTYACVERASHERAYPSVPHTWARLREGTYCGGGAVTIRPRALEGLERFLGRLGAARKNPLRLAAIFGADVLAAYALRRLTVAAAERRASDLLGLPVRAAICSRAEIAVNVDRASDVALAERLIAGKLDGASPALRPARER